MKEMTRQHVRETKETFNTKYDLEEGGGWGLMIWQSFKKAFTKTCWEADEKLGGPPQKMEVNRGVFEKYKDSQVGGGVP